MSPTCFERPECGFLHSAKTKRVKSMWLITGVLYTVSVLFLHCLIVSRMLQKVPLNFRYVWFIQIHKTNQTSRSDWQIILLEFSRHPINHDTRHFHYGFPGVLQRIITRQEIKRVNIVPFDLSR